MDCSSLKSLPRRSLLAVMVMYFCALPVGFTAELEEIIVTAERREESLSKVPVAVSAFLGDDLSQLQYTSLQDFRGLVPNMDVSDYAGDTRINLRGVGASRVAPGAEAGTALHFNGVYLGRPREGAAAFMDVERVEVLRGPQGTLYGRNATGGTVNIITKRPTDEFEASAHLTYGNYDTIKAGGVLSGGIVDERLFGRVTFGIEDRDGYSRNLFNGKHYDDASTQSVRGTLVFKATDDLTFAVVGDYHREDDGNYATHNFGEGVAGQTFTGVLAGGTSVPLDATGATINPRLLSVDSLPTNDRKSGGIMLEIVWDVNDELKAKSLSAYRSSSYRWTTDFDATTTPFPSNDPRFSYIQFEESDQFTQELQLSGTTANLDWLVGAFYMDEELQPSGFDFGFSPPPFIFPLLAESHLTMDAYAIFAQATYRPMERLGLTLGGRYSYEERTVDENWTSGGFVLGFFGPCLELPDLQCVHADSASFNAFTPKFGVEYQWTDGLMTYFSVSKGFKSGGFSATDLEPAFDPEKIWAYEAGVKLRSDDGRWSADLAGFHYDYSDLQITQVIDGFVSTVNAANSKVDGAEIELSAKFIDGLTITNSFAWLDARFDEFLIADPAFPELGVQDLSGNRLANAPEFSNNLGLSYELPVGDHTLDFYFEWAWRAKTFFTEFNLPNASQSAHSLLNASVRLTPSDKRWYIDLWGRNLTDELVISQNFISSGVLGRPRNGQLMPPRTYGVTLGYEF